MRPSIETLCSPGLMVCIDFFLVLFQYITAFIIFFLKCIANEALVVVHTYSFKCIQVS